MTDEPAEARRQRGQSLIDLGREDLELCGTDALQERITLLQAEIERSKAQLARKDMGRAAAEALFRSS
jgi:uncharacterized small protein (DUF1192 family)